MSQRVGGDATIGFGGTFTSSTNVVSAFDARWVHLRNLDGNATGLTQSELFGNEDGIGTQYSGEVKNFATAIDANGNPVLLVVSFADKRLDVYQLEPTWTNNGGGNWDSAGNWFNNTLPDSALLNANFGQAISTNSTVTLSAPRTTKNLKFENAAASYTLSGATLTINAPAGVLGQITNLAGNHTVSNQIVLEVSTQVRVNGASDTLSLSGGVIGGNTSDEGLTKLGPGTLAVRNIRADFVNVAESTVRVTPAGDNAGASIFRELQIANDGSGTFLAKFDLTNNAFVFTGDATAGVFAAITAGRNGGNWNGNGLTSSSAAASPSATAIGVATAGELGIDNFFGIPVQTFYLLGRYTRLGDSDLSGTTDIGDFALLAAQFNQGGTWYHGDYNTTAWSTSAISPCWRRISINRWAICHVEPYPNQRF